MFAQKIDDSVFATLRPDKSGVSEASIALWAALSALSRTILSIYLSRALVNIFVKQ